MYLNTANNKEKSLYHDFLSLLGISTSDTGTIPIADFVRGANKYKRRADNWIWESSGTWKFDDTNYTNRAVAVTDLVDGQQDYSLPSWQRDIERVEIKDNEGNYRQLQPIDKSQIQGQGMTEFLETNGQPEYYDMEGNSILLYPAPASGYVTTSEGLKVWFYREIKNFAVSDTSTEPGFDENFHQICSVGPAIDFAPKYAPHQLENLKVQLNELHGELQAFYGRRHKAHKKQLSVKPSQSDSVI